MWHMNLHNLYSENDERSARGLKTKGVDITEFGQEKCEGNESSLDCTRKEDFLFDEACRQCLNFLSKYIKWRVFIGKIDEKDDVKKVLGSLNKDVDVEYIWVLMSKYLELISYNRNKEVEDDYMKFLVQFGKNSKNDLGESDNFWTLFREYHEWRHSMVKEGEKDNLKNLKVDSVNYGICEDEDEDKDTDPKYRIFLNNLQKDGNSYVLKVHNDDGESLFIKYEAESGSDYEWNAPAYRKSRTVVKGNEIEKQDLRKNSINCNVENLKKLRSGLYNKTRRHEDKNNLISRCVNYVHRETNGYLGKKPGMKDNFTLNNKVVSDVKCGLQGISDPETEKNFRNVVKGSEKNAAKDSRTIFGKGEGETSKMRNLLETRSWIPVADMSMWSRGVNPVFGNAEGFPSQNYIPGNDDTANFPDEDFQTFLEGLNYEGDFMVFAIGGERKIYEATEVDSSSDSDLMITEKDPYREQRNYTPFVAARVFDASMERDDCQCLGTPSTRDCFLFRDELMRTLQKPYDHEEYVEVTVQKPKEGERVLRGQTKSYAKDGLCESYLAKFPDLKRKLDAVRFDKVYKLNILRGFFFWLKNLPCQGAFKPWLDKSCREVMPESS